MKYFALTFFKEKIVIKNGQRCAKGAFRKNGYSIMYEKTGSFFGPPQKGGGHVLLVPPTLKSRLHRDCYSTYYTYNNIYLLDPNCRLRSEDQNT